MQALGANIRKIIKAKKMKVGTLAEETGLSATYISGILNGKKTPSVKVIEKIADVLGVTMKELVLEQNDEGTTLEDENKKTLHSLENEAEADISVYEQEGKIGIPSGIWDFVTDLNNMPYIAFAMYLKESGVPLASATELIAVLVKGLETRKNQ